MPDVTLPNGQVIFGVPEGTNKFAIMEKAISSGMATPEDFGEEATPSAAGETGLQRFREGVGRGMTNIARQAGNIVGLVDDDEIREAEALDQDLMETGAGFAGSLVGEIAATAPIGGVLGMGAKAAGAVPGLARGANVLSRTLANPVGRGAVEGATVGALVGGPDNRLATAAGVGVLGGTFGAVGRGIGNLLKGKVRMPGAAVSEEALATQAATGEFIPLSHSLQPGIIKQVYEAILANLPGVGGRIRGQHANALRDFRRYAAEEAAPGFEDLAFGADESIQGIMGKLDDYWSSAYDDIFEDVVDAGGVRLSDDIIRQLERAGIDLPAPGRGQAGELLHIKNALSELLGKTKPGSTLQAARREGIQDGLDSIDDILRNDLSDDAWASYAAKAEPYENYMAIGTAVEAASKEAGEFMPKVLTQALSRRAGQAGRAGGGGLQQATQRAAEALPAFPSKQGVFQTAAALGLSSAGLVAVGVPALAAAPLAIGIGRLMVTKPFQRFISGQLKGAQFLDEYAKFLKAAGYDARQIASVLEAERENATRR